MNHRASRAKIVAIKPNASSNRVLRSISVQTAAKLEMCVARFDLRKCIDNGRGNRMVILRILLGLYSISFALDASPRAKMRRGRAMEHHEHPPVRTLSKMARASQPHT